MENCWRFIPKNFSTDGTKCKFENKIPGSFITLFVIREYCNTNDTNANINTNSLQVLVFQPTFISRSYSNAVVGRTDVPLEFLPSDSFLHFKLQIIQIANTRYQNYLFRFMRLMLCLHSLGINITLYILIQKQNSSRIIGIAASAQGGPAVAARQCLLLNKSSEQTEQNYDKFRRNIGSNLHKQKVKKLTIR